MLDVVKEEFSRLFGKIEESRCFFSPGRVNIIGEHIDYNGGYVMPCALNIGTYFVIKKNNTSKVRAYSMQFPNLGILEFDVSNRKKEKKWTDFVKGVLSIFDIKFGFDMVVAGTIPHSSGLSSSASFCTGLGYALMQLQNKSVDRTKLALLCKQVENEFMGVNCGIMDQFIVCQGQANHAILLNCNRLKYELIPFDLKDYALVIANTNKIRQLTDSKYNERKHESEVALEIINENGFHYKNLCDIKEDYQELIKLLPNEVLKKRFRHIMSENLRTLDAAKALKEGNIELLAKLLIESHESLKNDYEVTGMELDTLVNAFLEQKACIGARMTGAGFGGCAIALVEKNQVEIVKEKVKTIYNDTIGYEPSFYEVSVYDGVHEIK